MELTSTGTSLIPREYTRVSHSITLAFDFAWRRFAAFKMSRFRAMESWYEMRFFGLRCKGKVATPSDVLAAERPGTGRYSRRVSKLKFD